MLPAMAADALIHCRVSSETKELIRALANQDGVTESALLRSLVEKFSKSVPADWIESPERPLAGNRLHRFSIRLADEDQVLLSGRARERGLRPSTYVAVLMRAHLRALTPLPKAELLALRALIGELSAIGRNLNQLARVANTVSGAPQLGPSHVDLLLKVSAGLRDHVKALLLANERSWQTGHEPSTG